MTEERARFLMDSLRSQAFTAARANHWSHFYKVCWLHDTLALALMGGWEIPDYDEKGGYIEQLVLGRHIVAPAKRVAA